MEDAEIVALFLARDEHAISETANKYGEALRRLAGRILRDPADAEECENDTYREAWALIPPHEPCGYFYPFLARITRHLAIDRCRKASAQKRAALTVELTREMADCIPSPGDAFETLDEKALTETINRFLSALPEEQRNLFLRRYWFFDPVKDIAKRCGCSQSKVKTTLFRLREQLRAFLEKEGYEL